MQHGATGEALRPAILLELLKQARIEDGEISEQHPASSPDAAVCSKLYNDCMRTTVSCESSNMRDPHVASANLLLAVPGHEMTSASAVRSILEGADVQLLPVGVALISAVVAAVDTIHIQAAASAKPMLRIARGRKEFQKYGPLTALAEVAIRELGREELTMQRLMLLLLPLLTKRSAENLRVAAVQADTRPEPSLSPQEV